MSTKFVKILCNPVVAKLHEPEDEVRYLVSDMLSYLVEGAQFSGKGNWDGYASFYRMRTNSFPAGFVRLVQQKLTLLGYTVTIHKKPAPTPLGPEKPIVDSFPDDPRYDYQPEIAERLISLERMIAQVATGGGKSRIYKICERKLALPSLFLTTRKSLMYQMAENYEASFKMKVGILGDGVWEPRYDGPNFGIVDTISSRLEKVNVEKEIEKEVEKWYQAHEARVQTALKNMNVPDISAMRKPPAELANIVNEVRSRVEKKFPLNKKEITSRVKRKLQSEQDRRPVTLQFLEHIGFLCLEEAHEVSGNGFYAISNACKNAHYRLALTATPFMKDNEEANMRLMAATGPIGYTVSEKLLIERGILAKPYFKYIELPKPARLFKSTAWPRCYKIGIVENAIRNERIVSEAIEAISYGMTVMILVQRKDHGDILKKTLTTMGVKTKFIYGAHEQRDRKKALEQLGDGSIQVLIGSTILDVGIDVPSVGMIILAGGGKAEVNLRQRVGRGLRGKGSNRNFAFIVDFADDHNNHLVKHYRERRRIIESTPGFAENIVTKFDYEGLGFTRKA